MQSYPRPVPGFQFSVFSFRIPIPGSQLQLVHLLLLLPHLHWPCISNVINESRNQSKLCSLTANQAASQSDVDSIK